jgi:hypothetical protein
MSEQLRPRPRACPAVKLIRRRFRFGAGAARWASEFTEAAP